MAFRENCCPLSETESSEVPAALWQGDVQSSVPLASSKLAWTARCVDASVKRQ